MVYTVKIASNVSGNNRVRLIQECDEYAIKDGCVSFLNKNVLTLVYRMCEGDMVSITSADAPYVPTKEEYYV